MVSRPALFARLSGAPAGTVSLVCAPAGSGKTVLLRAWAEELEVAVAWATVDRGERDSQRFWLQVIDAIAKAAGPRAIERVTPAPTFAGEPVVERLLDQLGKLNAQLVLVIDDLHELESSEALIWLERLLAGLPDKVRVVLATREYPSLALHRLRLAGGLTEVRAPDLRFSLGETRALLDASGVTVSDTGLALLYERTEGWAAGLRLAAISLRAHPDPERFVSEFSGSERTVAGYLLAEVLERQPAEVRELLLRTSVVDRISGRLADALTGGTGAEAILQRLEDQNAFVTALDAARTWFRYHQLFADLLRLELRRVGPESIPALHRAAAQWHEQHGQVLEAVRHFQAAGDWTLAARLLTDNYLALTMAGRGQTLHALLEAFPPQAQVTDVNVAIALAVDSILHGLLEESAAHLGTARGLAATVPAERRNLVDVYIAVIELELARRHCDLPTARAAMDRLEAALSVAPVANQARASPEYRTLSLMNLGIVELWTDHPVRARQHLEDALGRTRRTSLAFVEVGCLAHVAMAQLLTGQPLSLALELSERATAIAEEHGWARESMTTGAYAAAAMVLALMGRVADAERQLDCADECLRAAADPGTQVVLRHTRGLLHLGKGRLAEAAAEFARAQDMKGLLVSQHAFMTEVHGRALQARVRAGDTESVAHALARSSPAERNRAVTRVALAALELDGGRPEQAMEALVPVIAGAAPAVHARTAQVEASLLSAIACERTGDQRRTADLLEAALELAEPEDLLLPFMLWPDPRLLERHPRHRSTHGTLISTILDALGGRVAPGPGTSTPLHEDLSEAELRVVRYLPSNLTAQEIASELIVSANTVRTHMRHIYAKLDAHTRSEAVARARALGLVGPRASGR